MASPKRESGMNSMSSREDTAKVSDHQHRRKDDERELNKDSSRNQYGKDSYRHSDRYSSRIYPRHHEYSRHDRRSDDEERRSSRESRSTTYSDHAVHESEPGRSRDYSRNADKYSRDKYDSSKHRSKDKELESPSPDRQKYGDKDASLDRKHALPPSKEKDRDRNGRDRDGQDAKRDYRRSFGDLKSNRVSYHEESKLHRNDFSGREHDELCNKESYKKEQKELNGRDWNKHDDSVKNKDKDWYSGALQEQNEEIPAYGNENQESLAKKPKLFTSGWDAEYSKNVVASEKQKQVLEDEGKATKGQVHLNNSETANDLNAAKVAAMKAAELVNKNLVGVGFMSTEQKKKLLWGNKKSATSQESGHRWDTPLFDDRDRQEKFNKLMGVKGDVNMEQKPETKDGNGRLQAEKQKEVQIDLEKQYTAGLRRRDGRTVGLGL